MCIVGSFGYIWFTSVRLVLAWVLCLTLGVLLCFDKLTYFDVVWVILLYLIILDVFAFVLGILLPLFYFGFVFVVAV